MTVPIIAGLAVNVLSAIFALAGVINLSGSMHFWAVYRFWKYPHNFYRIVGLTELLVALFLIVPETRIWGITSSGLIAGIMTMTLLHHRKYLWSLPAMLLLVALVPASLAHS